MEERKVEEWKSGRAALQRRVKLGVKKGFSPCVPASLAGALFRRSRSQAATAKALSIFRAAALFSRTRNIGCSTK
jgi:hypothetical protein